MLTPSTDLSLGVPPPKSIPYADFIQKHDIGSKNVVVDEFLDGTMINAFYDGSWKIATRTVVGANCTFYSTKTFHDMFHETNINYGNNNGNYS